MGFGMLDVFGQKPRDVRAEQQDEEQRMQNLARDPFDAMAYTAYTGAKLAGQGLGTAAVAAAGGDPRSPTKRNTDAIEAAKAQVAQLGLDPSDPKSMDEFYRQVHMILQKQGLVAEALAVAKEWNAEKRGNRKDDLAVAELQRKKDRDDNADALGWARVGALIDKGMNPKAASQIGKMISDMEALPVGHPQRALLAKAIENASASKVIVEQLGDRVILRDATTKAVIADDDKGLSPDKAAKAEDKDSAAASAYAEYMAGLQRQYNAAVELYNHRGVEGITGRFGRWVGEPGAFAQLATTFSSDDAGAALALYKQVTGGAFLAGLAKLKSASKTGASGLGAVSEKEGDKVQSDAAALDRLQQPGSFRGQLATYIHEIEGFGQRLTAAATADGVKPQPLAAKQLAAPGRGGRAPIAPKTAPAPLAPSTPAAPVAPASGGEWTPAKEQRLMELRRKAGK